MSDDLSEAAKRGLQRAAIHMVRAAIEVVEGVSAFLEELQAERDGERDPDKGPQRIELDGEDA